MSPMVKICKDDLFWLNEVINKPYYYLFQKKMLFNNANK